MNIDALGFDKLLELLQKQELPTDVLPHAIVLVAKHRDAERIARAKPILRTYLDHPAPLVRKEAIWALGRWWKFSEFEEKFQEILVRDPDEECRWTAASSLGSIREGTKDAATLKLLATVVLNEGEHGIVRSSAYGAILTVLGGPRASEALRMHDFIEKIPDVDWDLVRSLANP